MSMEDSTEVKWRKTEGKPKKSILDKEYEQEESMRSNKKRSILLQNNSYWEKSELQDATLRKKMRFYNIWAFSSIHILRTFFSRTLKASLRYREQYSNWHQPIYKK